MFKNWLLCRSRSWCPPCFPFWRTGESHLHVAGMISSDMRASVGFGWWQSSTPLDTPSPLNRDTLVCSPSESNKYKYNLLKHNFVLQNQVLQLRWWKKWVEGTNGPDEEERLQVSGRVLPGGHPSLPWQICPSWRRWSWLQLLVRKNPLLETHPCISHFITFRKSNPDILKFMTALNISGEFSKLESIYIHKLLDIVGSLPTRNGYIIWQVEIIKETIISYVFQLSIMFCF